MRQSLAPYRYEQDVSDEAFSCQNNKSILARKIDSGWRVVKLAQKLTAANHAFLVPETRFHRHLPEKVDNAPQTIFLQLVSTEIKRSCL